MMSVISYDLYNNNMLTITIMVDQCMTKLVNHQNPAASIVYGVLNVAVHSIGSARTAWSVWQSLSTLDLTLLVGALVNVHTSVGLRDPRVISHI